MSKELTKMLHSVDKLKGVNKPSNLVMVTIEDIESIFHELMPYTMSRLDDLETKRDLISNAKQLADKVLSL